MTLDPEMAADLCALLALGSVIIFLGRHHTGKAGGGLMLILIAIGVALAFL
ncbi:hypothetical protein RGUI_4091 [Rhodovulum sp. P5]|uniref:hypothetical protein n=1 Tax=Rhodovulum sp. P5 TaxID=1564506 RepID=UPI0009C2413C|nr:hypothetical protein [Rhodovulum sp. P5]ARE42232.1 hypothetical protein RGUI_4091 [Rhodovulum sp. P5]